MAFQHLRGFDDGTQSTSNGPGIPALEEVLSGARVSQLPGLAEVLFDGPRFPCFQGIRPSMPIVDGRDRIEAEPCFGGEANVSNARSLTYAKPAVRDDVGYGESNAFTSVTRYPLPLTIWRT